MTKRTIVPIGPYHALQEEPEFFKLHVEGETVVVEDDVREEIGSDSAVLGYGLGDVGGGQHLGRVRAGHARRVQAGAQPFLGDGQVVAAEPVRGAGGGLVLGTWQQIFHLECDVKPRRREIVVTAMGE